MRIEQLRLIAFGPFTDTVLDFSQGNHGLHLVLGANEAGKSSALRALIQMVFGIPARSADNFLHAHANLRIGGRLRRSDGTVIEFVRRKGQSKTLRAADDHAVLDDDAVVAFLGGIDETHFCRLFAIGHPELVQGGEELVSGGGQAGQAFFAAGSGLLRLRAVQEKLLRECEALFKPGGSLPAINRGLAELRDARKQFKESLLPARIWQSHDRTLREAEQRLTEVRSDLAGAHQEKNRLMRISAAMAPVARRAELLSQLVAYHAVPVLPDGFGDNWRQAEKQAMIAESQCNQARETIAKADARIDALGSPDRVLAHAEAIELLQRELGSYLKAAKDRPQLTIRMRLLEKEARTCLNDVGPAFAADPVKRPELPQTLVQQIQRLGKSYERWTTQLETLRDERRKLAFQTAALERQRQALQPALEASRNLASLKAALESALGAEPLQAQLAEERALLQAARQSAADQLRRQTLWRGAAEEVEALALPAADTIDLFEEQLAAATLRLEQLRAEHMAEQKALARTQADLAALELSQEVPTEEDLGAARALRDQGWALARRQLDGTAPEALDTADFVSRFPGCAALADAFEQSQRLADAIADRLRREADRVHRKARLLAEQLRLQTALAGLEHQIARSEADRKIVLEHWHAQWAPCGIMPLTPREMRAWIGEMRVMRDKLGEARLRRLRADAQTQALQELRHNLHAALTRDGNPPAPDALLADLIRTARTRLAEQEKARADADTLDKQHAAHALELEALDGRIATVEQQAAAWKGQWGLAVTRLGLEVETEPGDAVGVIESLRAARAKIDEADVLRQRIEGIDRDAATFEGQVDALARTVAPDLSQEPAHIRAAALNARLTAARQADGERKALAEQVDKAQKALVHAEARLAEGRAALALLCRRAGCPGVELLPATEARARERDALAAELREVEKQLRALSGGAGVEVFADAVTAVNPDGLEDVVNDLNRQIAVLEEERSRLDQAIGTERNELQRMDGSSRAAELAEQSEHLLARLESDIAHYARVKIAAAILAGAIERYREKNQGPLIERAGALFAQMTLGSFDALRAEYDDQGRPVLVGVRPDGRQVRVPGMSDGSADQLYLALRLATLDAHMRQNEPLPFVVDDILMRFDDGRAAATLAILAELSARTQVIFFTHHRHLVELAQASAEVAPVLRIHRLGLGNRFAAD